MNSTQSVEKTKLVLHGPETCAIYWAIFLNLCVDVVIAHQHSII